MYSVLTILIVILAVLLVLLVLVQNSKGGGLTSNFASTNQIMGVRKTTDFLEKTTWGLIAAIVVLCVAASAFHKTSTPTGTSEITKNIEMPAPTNNFDEAAATPAAPAEATEAAPAE